MNGLAFERLVANVLRDYGLVVYRSAASRGCADLVVLTPGPKEDREAVTVQCKTHGRVKYERIPHESPP